MKNLKFNDHVQVFPIPYEDRKWNWMEYAIDIMLILRDEFNTLKRSYYLCFIKKCALHSQKNAKWVIADYCFRCILFYSQRAFYNQCVLQSVHSKVGAFYSQLPTIGSFYSQYSVPWLKLYIINFENFEVHHIWANIQGDNAAFFWFLIKALPSRRKRSKDIRIWLRQITRTR